MAQIALLVCVGVVAALVPGALASGGLAWGTGAEAPLPAGAASNPGVSLPAVSCPSAGNCAAVGSYIDGSSDTQGLLLSETSGAWTAAEAQLPSAATNPGVFLTSVACASAGNCTAVGGYLDGSSHSQGLLLTETAGSWATGATAPVPANAATNPEVQLSSVSCPSATDCTAVGEYVDSSADTQGLLLNETSGTWTAVEAPLPSASANPLVSLSSVACASAGNCTAVGGYSDSSGFQGLLLTETAGSWASPSGPAPVPGNAAANPGVLLSSVSCSSAGNCAAVGDYFDGSFNQLGLLLTQTSGSWSASEAALPSDASTSAQLVDLSSVSCVSSGECTAVGGYYDTSSNPQGVLLTESSGSWGSGTEATLPAGASSPSLFSVSCASAGNCAAVGSYTDSSSAQQGLLLSESSGSWGAGEKATLPAGASTGTPAAVALAASCPGDADCTAVGTYSDSSGNQQGLLLSTSASPTLAVSGPSTGTAGTAIPASSISATLSGGTSPTGTITFKVFAQATAPTDCSGGTTVGTPVSVSGNGTYNPSAPFTPASAGDYWWYASYGGDGNNGAAASTCGTLMAETTVGKATTTLSASGPSSGTAGTAIPGTSISATLSGGATPGGTITFKVFGPQSTAPTDCSAGTTIGTANVSGNGTYNPTTGFTPISGGDYWWYASYGGDTNNSAADSTCGDVTAETVVSFPNDTPVFSEVTDSPFVTGAEPFSVSFSPDGNLLATANYGANTVSVFSVGSGGALTQVSVRSVTAPNAVAFSSDGKHLAATDFTDGSVWMFSVGSGGKLTGVSGSPFATGAEPVSVSFSPDRNLLATANDGANTVSVFSVGSGGALTQLSVLSVDSPDAVAFSPSGGLLAATERGFSSSVAVFSVGSEGTLTEVTDQGMPGTNLPDSVSFSPDGKLLATADPGTDGVSVYSVGSGGALAQLGDFTAGGAPQSVAFSPSGRLLATANHDSDTASVFSVTSGGTLTEVSGSPFSTGTGSGPNSVAFSPDGKLFATANSGNDTVSVFSAANSTTASSSTSGGTATAILGSGTTATATGEGSMTLKDYSSDPTPTPAPAGSAYFDVHVSAGNSFSKLTVTDCNLNGATSLEWWNGSAWRQVSPVSSSPGPPACLTATLDNSTSSPRISQLTGTVFAAAYLGKPRVGRVRVRGATARVRTRCTGVRKDRCLVALVLEKRHGRRTRILGRAKVMLEAERARTVRVALDRAGKRLLAQHRTLKATLAITQLGHRLSSRTITFKAPRDEEWHEPPTRR